MSRDLRIARRHIHVVQLACLLVADQTLGRVRTLLRRSAFSLTFSTTCGKALRGMGSARLRFLTRCAVDGTAAASAAALARPCNASIGAFKAARGRVSSDSSSDDGAVLGTIPYVAYLCGCAGDQMMGLGGWSRDIPEAQSQAAGGSRP